MSDQHQLSSSIFQVDRASQEIDLDKHFFKKQIQIVKQEQPRKVIFGQMEEKERSLYQILSPYMAIVAQTTGNLAVEAGSMAYKYLKEGFWWFYDQITNKLIPYTQQQLPKLIFIISKATSQQQCIKSSQFCVLQVEQQDYRQIQNSKKEKNGPIKILIPLGENDQSLIQQIKKNHEVSYSFPIDDELDERGASQTYYLPSQSYELIDQEVRDQFRKASRALEIVDEKQQEEQHVNDRANQQNNETKLEKKEQQTENLIEKKLEQKEQKGSQIPEKANRKDSWQQLNMSSLKQKQKPKPKAIILPKACYFIYEQQDELYPFLKQRLQADQTVVTGHLINSEQLKKKQSGHSQGSGQVPLITVDNKIGPNITIKHEDEVMIEKKKKVVDNERKVRVQIGQDVQSNKNYTLQKKAQKQLMFN